jgi:hypothetical protein
LTVQVSGGTPDKGQAILSLFSMSENYLKAPLMKKKRSINSEGEALFTIEQLKAGTYAVSVIYDEDSDNELNTGFLGIPTELVGFSNNAKGDLAPHLLRRRLLYWQRRKQFILLLPVRKSKPRCLPKGSRFSSTILNPELRPHELPCQRRWPNPADP